MVEKKIDYGKVKVGLEVHQQLDTRRKLFCGCSTEMKEKDPARIVMRKMHPVESELGQVDVAVEFEFLRNRTFHYQVFRNETCLVELDEEPPHPLNQESLELALKIALLFDCKIPDEIQVMRKTVIDGSNTSGFQRTAIVGMDGKIKFKGKIIGIPLVVLEEDAAATVSEAGENVTYRLNRLGVPLVEISTESLEGFDNQEIQEIAFQIGMLARSVERIKKGIGAIRQDLNISVRGGNRVEVKGVQELGMISKVVDFEVRRQLSLPKVEKEVRGAMEDGTTRFMRPLPGAERMYPETDISPIPVSRELVEKLRKQMPEPFMKKYERMKTKYKLSEELVRSIVNSEYFDIFERIIEKTKAEPTVVANTFISTLKDLEKREKVDVKRIREEHLFEMFEILKTGRILKEAIPEILKYIANYPGDTISNAVKELNLIPISSEELKSVVKDVLSQPGLTYEKAVGIVMSKVRGRIDAQIVLATLKKMMKK